MNKEQFAVYEIEPAHGSIKNGIILGPFATREEAETIRLKYGYSSDNYYVDSMNKEIYNQIIDDAYKNYVYKQPYLPIAGNSVGKLGSYKNPILSKEQFINRIKPNSEFSKKWGLKIEERELSFEERRDEYIKRNPQETNDGVLDYKWIGDNLCNSEDYDKWNIPTRLITLTYNNETIKSYE
jgi:hypothetical protein